jgi:hypothetical protein
VLVDPAHRIGDTYELTGPASLDIDGRAAEYTLGLGRPIHGTDIPQETWLREVLTPLGLPAHVEQHLATMASLHRAGRYDRATDDVERIAGQPASTLGQYIGAHPELFS